MNSTMANTADRLIIMMTFFVFNRSYTIERPETKKSDNIKRQKFRKQSKTEADIEMALWLIFLALSFLSFAYKNKSELVAVEAVQIKTVPSMR